MPTTIKLAVVLFVAITGPTVTAFASVDPTQDISKLSTANFGYLIGADGSVASDSLYQPNNAALKDLNVNPSTEIEGQPQ